MGTVLAVTAPPAWGPGDLPAFEVARPTARGVPPQPPAEVQPSSPKPGGAAAEWAFGGALAI